MSEIKWTPGPWETDRKGYLVGAGDKRVVVYGLDCSMSMVSPSEEERANAKIMQAAPDLYEALKAAEQFEGDLINEWADFWDVAPQKLIDSIMHAQDLRNAALAKARGESPGHGSRVTEVEEA